MDTDDLSTETYKGIITTAEEFNHDLTLQFGIMSYDCDNDDDFLDACRELIEDWLNNWAMEDVMEDIFYDDVPDEKEFRAVLDKIVSNIKKVKKIPIAKRTFEPW
ncbi:MAG: hypothetical protein WCH34_09555 [Bacteroidota bacterium]